MTTTPARAAAHKAAARRDRNDYYGQLANENPTGYQAGHAPWDMHTTTPATAKAHKETAVSTEPFFSQVHVKLTGEDGNGFMIVARVRAAMRKAGLQAEAERYVAEATSGNYDHLLQTTMKYVEVS